MRVQDMAFTGTWRVYQDHALEAFERDRAGGRRRTHVVAPPGSGKTLMGLEMVRRIGAPALVLAPNSAVQGQWVGQAARFGAPGVAGPDVGFPVACLTYAALCQVEDPAAALGDVAERRWAAERAEATGVTPEAALAEGRAFTGAAAERRARELRTISAAVKREVARAEHGDVSLADLLADGARGRVQALRAAGVGTVVLDECHHLASLWGYVVRTAVEMLGDVHLVGLTATPPGELTSEEAALYAALLGEVDFEVPTPAVVRDGHLAPYQELAWLTRPLDAEAEWLAEHDERFRELVAALHADPAGPLSFPAWVTTRMRHRGREGDDAEVSWARFQRRRPALARAGARFLASAGLPLPEGAPHGEGFREPPALDDWVVLLEDYAMSCLRTDPSPEAARRDGELAAALRDLGFTLTRRGIRRGASDTDRLLTGSAAKGLALVEVLSCEDVARGDRLRALVLTDGERAAGPRDDALVGVLRPAAQTAPEAVRALAADARTAGLRPLLVSGRGLRCDPGDADGLLAALAAAAPEVPAGAWAAEPEDGLARLVARHPSWRPGRWVAAATAALDAGATRALVGTRAMLGEGWDAPCVNCLVDLTMAATAVSVAQMRGRSLRLDPDDPLKIASNWDVVCLAPGLARGDADYARFVRKHLHLLAPGEDGAIEAGPTHVHPDLGPFAPPPAEAMDEINRQMARRAADHDAARDRWAVGTPYADQVLDTLVVRPRRHAGAGAGASGPLPDAPVPPTPGVAAPLSGGGVVAAGALGAAAVLAAPVALAGLVALPVAAWWAARRLGRAERELPLAMPIELAALALRDAYLELGELSPAAAASLAVEPRASGYLRVWLRRASPEEGARFTAALDDLLEPVAPPRYLVSRPVPDHRGGARLLLRAVTRRPVFARRLVAVPADLGRRKDRAEAFARAWRRWFGPCALEFTQRSEEGRERLALAGAEAGDHLTARRRVWR